MIGAGNTRVVGQKELDKFREDMTAAAANPYTVILNQGKVPFGLLSDPFKVCHINSGCALHICAATRHVRARFQMYALMYTNLMRGPAPPPVSLLFLRRMRA